MNETEFRQRFPNASRDTALLNAVVQNAEPKSNSAPALERAAKGEKEGMGSVTVRFKGFRCRPLDPDNFAGSVKGLLDGLRHAHLICGDEPWKIKLEVEQTKVKTFAEERTELEIIWP